MAKKILITGASGLIGERLTELLLAQGHSVSHLGRTKKEGKVPSFVWDIQTGNLDVSAFRDIDTIIHLAGAGIADKRWTAARKKEILESRTKSTLLLLQTLKNNSHAVSTFISASAIGYYGFSNDEKVFTEEDTNGCDFLAEVTKQWENEADKISSLGVRVATIRIGIVLSEKGGALKEMVEPIKFGIGSPLGTGNQFLSWIHIDDLCRIFMKAVEDENVIGTYNGVSDWCTNETMTRTIASALNKPLWLPNVPSFVLKLILGEMADMVLKGSKISSEKIKQAGFQFKFLRLEDSVKNLMLA